MAVTAEEADARKAFGLLLARLRDARGLSQIALRDALLEHGYRTTPGNVGMWETGQRAPGRAALQAIELALAAPGIGLVLGIDTGALSRLSGEVSDLHERVDRLERSIEGATGDGAGGPALRIASDADEGGKPARRSPGGRSARPRPGSAPADQDV